MALKSWQEIAQTLGRDENVGRQKWKHLRDRRVEANAPPLLDFHSSRQMAFWCITANSWNGVWTGKCARVERQTDADPQL